MTSKTSQDASPKIWFRFPEKGDDAPYCLMTIDGFEPVQVPTVLGYEMLRLCMIEARAQKAKERYRNPHHADSHILAHWILTDKWMRLDKVPNGE